MTEHDPALVELIAREIVKTGCHCASTSWADALDDARAALSALTAAGLLPVEREWSIRYPGGTVQRTGTFTEAGARQRADELAAEPVWRYAGHWQPDTEETP